MDEKRREELRQKYGTPSRVLDDQRRKEFDLKYRKVAPTPEPKREYSTLANYSTFSPTENIEDIKETFGSAKDTLKRTATKFKTIFEENQQRKQTPVESGVQYAGTAIGGATGLLTDVGIGLAKLALPQKAEEAIGGVFTSGVKKVGELSVVDKAVEKYQNLSPRTQRNIGAVTEIVSTVPVIGAPKFIKTASGQVIKTATKQADELAIKAIDDLEQTYTNILTNTKIGQKKSAKIQTKTENLNKAGTFGVTPQRTLAESGIIPKVSGTKLDTFEQAQDFRRTAEPLREANRRFLQESSPLLPRKNLDDLEKLAISEARTPLNINSGRFQKMKRDIQKEFKFLKQEYPQGVSLLEVDDIKSARWDNVFKNKGLVDADLLKKDSEYAIAKALQKDIENTASSIGNKQVAQLNREIGSILDASKFLEDLNGTTLKGGRLLKYVSTIIGSQFGQSPIGQIAGALGGNLVGGIIVSSQVSNPLKRLILRRVKKQNPQAYLDTVEWLAKQENARQNRLLLPAGDTEAIRLFDGIQRTSSGAIKENKIELLPAKKGKIGVDPKTGRFMRTYTQEIQSKSPTSQQTIPAINNDAIKPIKTQSTKTPKKSSKLSDFAERLKNTPNKQGGFIKLPQGKGEQSGLSAKSSLPKNTKETFIGKVEEGYKPAPLTTKLLRKLEGKTTVSKQFISDLTNSPDLKQVEKDLIRSKLEGKGDKINVADFGKEVEAELLPLKIAGSKKTKKQLRKEIKNKGYDIEPDLDGGGYIVDKNGDDVDYDELPKDVKSLFDEWSGGEETYRQAESGRYESIVLPDDIRGNVADYMEHIYESPIKTSAGNTHFSGKTENYFGHTRIEDMADNSTRRVIEVQSDLFQKGGLENEMKTGIEFVDTPEANALIKKDFGERYWDNKFAKEKLKRTIKTASSEYSSASEMNRGNLFKYLKTKYPDLVDNYVANLNKGVKKLEQYNNPTAHFRMVREEIQKASKDGKTKLQFPTGETAMKIEGLGEQSTWRIDMPDNYITSQEIAKPTDLKLGLEITDPAFDRWVVTEVLGEGKFKAVPVDNISFVEEQLVELGFPSPDDAIQAISKGDKRVIELLEDGQGSETFDISGKVDTNNPIYKFYNKELQNYLKNNFKAQQVVDENGVSWLEVPITKEYKNIPIEAFGIIGAIGGASLMSTE